MSIKYECCICHYAKVTADAVTEDPPKEEFTSEPWAWLVSASGERHPVCPVCLGCARGDGWGQTLLQRLYNTAARREQEANPALMVD